MKRTNKGAVLAALLSALMLIAALPGCGTSKLRVASPAEYAEYIKKAAAEHGLSPYLVAAVINTESSFRPDAVSSDGAEGLMQVLPMTAEWIDYRRGSALEDNGLFDPETNVDYGCWLLSYLLDRYGGNERYALIAYNAGFSRLDSWLAEEQYLDENGELSVIPYAETRNYVEKINRYKAIYEEEYADLLG